MRWDIEIAISQIVADFLTSVLDGDLLAACPAVTFFDPMSVDEANRIVVQIPDGETGADDPGTGAVMVNLVVKSQWKQAGGKEDMATHFDRVNKVRDQMMRADLKDQLNALAPSGVGIAFVQPKRSFHTTIRQGWTVSEDQIQVNYWQI